METGVPIGNAILIRKSWGVYRDGVFHLKRGDRSQAYPCGHSGYDANQYRYTYFRRSWVPCRICIKEFARPE